MSMKLVCTEIKLFNEYFEEWSFAEEKEYLSECDACGKMKRGCRDVVYMGMDTHACPQCMGEEDVY